MSYPECNHRSKHFKCRNHDAVLNGRVVSAQDCGACLFRDSSNLSLVEKAKKVSDTIKKLVSAPGRKLAKPEVAEARLLVCNECPSGKRTGTQCRFCSCHLPTMAALAQDGCRLGHWKDIT